MKALSFPFEEQELHADCMAWKKDNVVNKIVPVDAISISLTADMTVSKCIGYSLADEGRRSSHVLD